MTFGNEQWQEAIVNLANVGFPAAGATDISTTGTISADQGAVNITFGAGAASWLVDARGTFNAGTTLFFEFSSDNSNWQAAYGVPVGSTSDVAVSSVAGGAAIVYQGNAAGFQYFRVRAHPFAGGDSVSIKIVGSVATDGGFVSKSLPPGTNSIGAVTQGTGAAAGTSWSMKGDYTEQASLSAGSLNADLVASTDVSAYKWLSLHVNANAYVGTLTFQASNDNSNWVNVLMYRIDTAASTNAASNTSLTNTIFAGAVQYRYFRTRMTAYTSGTAQGTLELYTSTPAISLVTMAVVESGTWTVQPGNTPNSTAWLVTANMPASATGTLTSVAGTTTASTQLLASNASRKGMYLYNESAAILYLGFNATVTTTSYTAQVGAQSFFEMPTAPIYTGVIAGVWASATGNARITELS